MTENFALFDDDWEIDDDLIDQASSDLNLAIKSGQWLDTREVKLGAPVGVNGALTVSLSEDDSQFPYEVWFTEIDDSWFSSAINTVAQPSPGTHVELGRPPKDPLNWYVRELSFTPEQPASAFSGTSPHAGSHNLIGVGPTGDSENIVSGVAGNDPITIGDRGLWSLGIMQVASMSIRIGNGSFNAGGVRVEFAGWDSPDWTGDIPATPGKAFWRLLEINNQGVVSYTDSSEFTKALSDALTLIPAGKPDTHYQCGAVFFENGMTVISWNYITSNPGLRTVVNPPLTPITASAPTTGPGVYEVVTLTLAITLTLSAADTAAAGREITVKDIDGNAGINNITIDGDGALIDGQSEFTLNRNYDAVTIYTDGTNWRVKSRKSPNKATRKMTPLSYRVDKNQARLDVDVYGSFVTLETGEVLNSGSPIGPTTLGTSKVIIAGFAGADAVGTITITGDTKDRNTGVITAADTEVLTMAMLATNHTSADAESNVIHGLSNALITTKWFVSSITVSTTNVSLTDVNVYACSFYQFSQLSEVVITRQDLTVTATNNAAWLYSYLYAVKVFGANSTDVNIQLISTLSVPSASADLPYRDGRSPLNTAIDGRHEGVFMNVFPGPINLRYWQIEIITEYTSTEEVAPSPSPLPWALGTVGRSELGVNTYLGGP